MRINKNSKVLWLYITILLFALITGPGISVADDNTSSSSINETMIHTYSQNTWAWNSLATGPNGETYLTHKVSSTEIAIKKWNGSDWDSLSSVTTTLTGDTGFSDSLDLAVDKTGKLHLVFKHYIGSGVTSKRGVKYATYDGTSWTFSEVEAYSDSSGGKNFYDPALDVDSNGHAHIVYKYVDTSYYARYATNKSGSWHIENLAIGGSGIDEIHDPSVQVDDQDVIHISYVKEDNQNDYYGNFYYTKKSLDDARFPVAEKVVDAVSEEQSYVYSPLTVDNEGNVYFTFSVSSYDTDWNLLGSKSYIHSNSSGIWNRETLYDDQERDTYPVGVYTVGSNLYVLMDSWSNDWTENYLFAMADYGDGWIKGNKNIKPSLVLDSTNELTLLIDSNGDFMIAMLHGELKKISSLTGTSEDFGLVTLPQEPEVMKGDGNGDGKVTPADVQIVYQAVAGKLQLTDLQKKALDMNDDGVVDSKDAVLIMKVYVGK